MKKFKYFIAGAVALALYSCDNYLDQNSPSPNNVSLENLTPDKHLQAALSETYITQARTMSRLGNYFMQNWYGDVSNYTGVEGSDEFTYNLNNGFGWNPWNGLYLGINNFSLISTFDSDKYDNHKAVALIMKSYYMQYIVDLYGDAPYSEAFLGSLNLTPKYDSGKDIYVDLIDNIDNAFVLFANADDQDVDFSTSDIVFGGDVNKWIAFGNTLKLKLLVRESAPGVVDAGYFSQKMGEVQALNMFLDTDATINPGYNTTTDSSLNPYYNIFFKSDGSIQQYSNYAVATQYVGDFLNGDNSFYTEVPANVVDPRRGFLYKVDPTSGDVVGIEQGAADYSGEPSFAKSVMSTGDADGVIMTLAEVKFLLAEAYEKGFLSGDAAMAYAEGVQASFDLLGAGSSAGYLAQFNASSLGWSTNHMRAIMIQKWIATNSYNPTESYIDLTRTGYPNVPLSITHLPQYNNRPYRLFYPLSEYNGNSANVPNISLDLIFQTGPFWKN